MILIATKKGQSAVEYAVMFAVIIAALLAIQVYLQRGFLGRYRGYADQAGSQFDPHRWTANYSETVNASRREQTFANGAQQTTSVNERQGRTGGVESLQNLTNSLF